MCCDLMVLANRITLGWHVAVVAVIAVAAVAATGVAVAVVVVASTLLLLSADDRVHSESSLVLERLSATGAEVVLLDRDRIVLLGSTTGSRCRRWRRWQVHLLVTLHRGPVKGQS